MYVQYGDFLKNIVVHQSLGRSYASRRPVTDIIKEAAPVTASITVTRLSSTTALTTSRTPSTPGQAVTFTATIPANQTSMTLAITVKGDTAIERNESLNVRLSAPVGAILPEAGGYATGTIRNDDFPTLSIADARASEGSTGQRTAIAFTVSMSQLAPFPVSFDLATNGAGNADVAIHSGA